MKTLFALEKENIAVRDLSMDSIWVASFADEFTKFLLYSFHSCSLTGEGKAALCAGGAPGE